MVSLVQRIETPEPLAGIFQRIGIANITFSHRPVFTVEEGRDVDAQIPGGHSKNLFLKDKNGKLWLVSALDRTVIDLKWLPKRIACGRLSFGKPELMQQILGVTPGSVTPFALLNDRERAVTPVLDAALFAHETVNFHPLINDKTTSIAPDDLLKFMRHLGYDPLVVDFARG